MGYYLLWVESAAVVVLASALMVRWVSAPQGRALGACAALLCLACWGGYTALGPFSGPGAGQYSVEYLAVLMLLLTLSALPITWILYRQNRLSVGPAILVTLMLPAVGLALLFGGDPLLQLASGALVGSVLLLAVVLAAMAAIVYRHRRLGIRLVAAMLVLAVVFLLVTCWLAGASVSPGAYVSLVSIPLGIACVLIGWSLRRSRVFVGALVVPWVLLPLAAVVTLTRVVGQIKFRYGFVGAPFEAMIALSVLCAAAQIALVYYGFFRRNGDGSPAAAHWPAMRLLAGLALAVALVGATVWNLDAAVAGRLASLRTEAGVLAMSVAPPRVPDHRNAAMVYRQAFEVLAAHRDDLARCRKRINFQPADWLSLDPGEPGLREMVGKLQPAVRLLRRGAAVPECYFDRDWSRPSMATILSEAQDLREGAEVLVADVVVKTKDGRTTEALEDISALFGMAAHVKQEPFAVTLLIAKVIEKSGLGALEHVLARARPTPAELTSLTLPQLVPYAYTLERVFRAEEAMWLGEASDGGYARALLEMALRPSDVRRSPPAGLAVWAAPYRVFLLEGDLAAYQKEIKRWGRELAGHEPFRREPFPFRFVEEYGRDRPMAADLGPVPGEFLHGLRLMWWAAGDAEAVQRLARVAAAAARFRASAKADLQRLDQLVPEYLDVVPADPFDGKPLKMVRTDKGLVVYSIGPDKKDDGGSPPKPEDWRLGDVTIRLPK